MRKPLSAGWLVLSMALMCGCAKQSKVAVTVAGALPHPPAAKPVDYESVREALRNLDFDYQGERGLTDREKRFTETLRLITQGRDAESEKLLRELLAAAVPSASTSSGAPDSARSAPPDSLLLQDVKTILGTMLFYQSRWEELLALDLPPDGSPPGGPEEDSGRILAGAYQGSDRETYTFLSDSSRFPTTFTASGVPTIEVEVNGKRKKFLLDTGAEMSVVSHKLAEECRISPLGYHKTTAGTSTSKKVGIRPAVVVDFKIGDLSIKNHPVIIIDQGDLQFKLLGLITIMKIEGIIGWNAIRNLVVEVDYPNKVTTIDKPETREREASGRNLFVIGGYPVVRLRSENGVPLNFGLDTGARESWISENLLRKLGAPATTSVTRKVGSAGGWETVDSKVLPELTLILRGLRLTFERIGTRPARLDEFVELDGVLGGDVFKNGRIRVDYQNGVFDFTAPALFSTSRNLGGGGENASSPSSPPPSTRACCRSRPGNPPRAFPGP